MKVGFARAVIRVSYGNDRSAVWRFWVTVSMIVVMRVGPSKIIMVVFVIEATVMRVSMLVRHIHLRIQTRNHR